MCDYSLSPNLAKLSGVKACAEIDQSACVSHVVNDKNQHEHDSHILHPRNVCCWPRPSGVGVRARTPRDPKFDIVRSTVTHCPRTPAPPRKCGTTRWLRSLPAHVRLELPGLSYEPAPSESLRLSPSSLQPILRCTAHGRCTNRGKRGVHGCTASMQGGQV